MTFGAPAAPTAQQGADVAKAKTDRAADGPASARGCHHGNLRQALLEAALKLAQQHGPGRVSVRHSARRIGVSPGAPFRHFPNRRALVTALAEEAAVSACASRCTRPWGGRQASPLQRLRSLGRGSLLTRRAPSS
jgi:AcrR family transcriptional regulator